MIRSVLVAASAVLLLAACSPDEPTAADAPEVELSVEESPEPETSQDEASEAAEADEEPPAEDVAGDGDAEQAEEEPAADPEELREPLIDHVDVAEVDELQDLADAAEYAGIELVVPTGLELLHVSGSDTAEFATFAVEQELEAVAALYMQHMPEQGWPLTRPERRSRTGDEAAIGLEFAEIEYGADFILGIAAEQTDGDPTTYVNLTLSNRKESS